MRRSPTDLRRDLAQVAAEQAGYFSAAQAVEKGYSYPAQRYHVERGSWTRVDRGIFRLPEWPSSPHEDLVRWTLWSRHRAVVSHATAIAVHELGDVMPSRVHLTVPPGFRARSPGVQLHIGTLASDDIEQREGFSVTTPIRSILDAATSGLETDQLTRVVTEAIQRGLLTDEELDARSEEFGPRAALFIEKALRTVSS